jgi:hypothetical protein
LESRVNHVTGFLGGLGAGVHGYRHVGLGQRRCVVGAIAGHCDQTAFRLVLADQLQFGFRSRFGEEIIDSGFGRDGCCRQVIVAGDHHRLDAHAAQLGKTLLDTPLDDVLEFDSTQHPVSFSDDQWCRTTPGDFIDRFLYLRRPSTALGGDVGTHGIGSTLADTATIPVDAAHPGLGGEMDEDCAFGMDVATALMQVSLASVTIERPSGVSSASEA